jgi:hypothetical protein
MSAVWYASPSHLTSCTRTKSNLYFSNSPTTDLIAPTLQTPYVPSTKSHVLFPMLRSCQRISPGPRRFETFRNNRNFYGEILWAPRPAPKLEDHSLSAIRDCLFNIVTATPVTGGLPPIRSLRTRHAVVTRDPTNMDLILLRCLNQGGWSGPDT